ncbi:VOC family protein [Gloeocapsopsis crepidinum LEGE 06123]|uniref:VOC family protein n=1 Tax=Gloeocapsopsis crepidinum LEGE 06123 TaxID=588587 RepID=A0ABR9UR47_9CHRO|nr:VOC family protein [Gloeocapsopsis crepidinum]MBE9189818.1 VOC family protein [Gloeocapsopsis crepidinum LEGE 06123]
MKLGAIHHIALTVSDMKRSEAFYNRLLGFMGYEQGEKTEQLILWASSHSAITISRANSQSNQKCDRYSPGLHHLAFSADSREDVDKLYQVLIQQQVTILDPPAEYEYLPGYYAVYFLDPDGIKLELAHTPTWSVM